MAAFLTISFNCNSQTEQGLLPYSNNLLLNPSFAGFNKSTSVWGNFQFFAESKVRINHTSSITYDTWLEKFDAGAALYFYQGLKGETNTTYTGGGFTFSKPLYLRNSELIPSVNINYFLYTKQWLVLLLDETLDKEYDEWGHPIYLPPGEELFRNHAITPRAGLLWNTREFTLGVSASRHYAFEDSLFVARPYLVFHASRKMSGNQKGLESKPFKAHPEMVVLVSKNQLLTRAGFRIQQVDHLMALYIQNNFTDNIHGIVGTYGWRSDILNVNFTAGGAYSVSSEKPVLYGEISLGLVLPYQIVNEIDPWAPPDKSY